MARKENTFIQVFETQSEVLRKVSDLKAEGYKESDMYVVGRDNESFTTLKNQTDVHIDTVGGQQEQGFMGKFMSALSGESSSMEAFNGMGLSQTESEDYYRQVQDGKLVLYVDSEYGDSYDRYSQSAGVSQTSGTDTAYTSGTARSDTTANLTGTDASDEERLRLHEERLNVDKERVQTGEVNVGKHVVEENKTVDVPVEREEAYIERRPVNKEVSGTDAFTDNDTVHVPLSEERVNVTKKDVVAEEIVVGKRKVQDTEHVEETVRREEADIDEDANTTKNKNTKKGNRF